MFNRISSWTQQEADDSEANEIIAFLAGNLCEWISAKEMTDEEKEKHPEYETTGGYLKKFEIWENASDRWGELREEEKAVVMSIPNFDKEVFKEVTGIDVDED